jgi:hypothetical protein
MASPITLRYPTIVTPQPHKVKLSLSGGVERKGADGLVPSCHNGLPYRPTETARSGSHPSLTILWRSVVALTPVARDHWASV